MPFEGFRVLYAASDGAVWQSLVDRLPSCRQDILLTPAYARVQSEIGGGSPVCLVYQWHDQFVMQPAFLRSDNDIMDLTSFYGGGGPASTSRLWFEFDRAKLAWVKRSNIVCEYCQLSAVNNVHSRLLMGPNIHCEEVRQAVVVDIEKTDEELLRSFSRNRQRAIDVETKKNLPWKETENWQMFANKYREDCGRDHRPSWWRYPDSYWQACVKELGSDRCTIFNASDQSMLLVVHGYGKAHAMFLAGAKLHSLLYFEAMKHARDVGCRKFYLGGGTSGAPDDPLLQYKLSFSKCTVGVHVYKRIYDQANYDSACDRLGRSHPTGWFPAYRWKEGVG